jgi:hypothetical protein
MSPDEIDKLTLGELRAIAERAHETLSLLAKVQGLLNGAAQPGVAVNNGGQAYSPAQTPASTKPPNQLSQEQQKEMEAWKNSPARLKLLEQMKPTPNDLPPEMSAAERKEQAKVFGKDFGQ